MVDYKAITENIHRRIEELGAFSTGEGKGVTRLPFTNEYRQATEYLKKEMLDLGLTVREDESGALIGRLEGRKKKAFIIGSHLDTVENGGKFDGLAGIVSGLAVIEILKAKGIKLPEYSIEIMATHDEEGARFSCGFFSSKAMVGDWTMKDFKSQIDKNGVTLYNAMVEYGLSPEKVLLSARPEDEVLCFIEPHIEQGRVLESSNTDVAILTGIVGMRRLIVTVRGRRDHAGTTAMNMRKDALNAAARMVAPFPEIAEKYKDMVLTCGYISALPNAVNTIAGEVEFSVDMRSMSQEDIAAATKEMYAHMDAMAKLTDTEYSVRETLYQKPLRMNSQLMDMMEKACENNSISHTIMHSGAGHDSLVIGKKWPVAMMFIPSKDGRSHCPEEFTDYKYITNSAIIVAEMAEKMNFEL